jgi:hypothetical protein
MAKRKHAGGRPEKIDAIVLQKLEAAFSNAATDEEACFYAGIAPKTLYNYQNRNPKFVQRKEGLKNSPNLQAKSNIARALNNGVVPTSQWWLEKKDPEFRPTSKLEHSGTIETSEIADIERSPEELAAIKALREARLKRIRDNSDKMV